MPTHLALVPKKQTDPERIVGFFRRDLRAVVSTHRVMFDRLLFKKERLSLELADLFEDVGNRYLDISYIITELHRPKRPKRQRKKLTTR